jgi:ADP-heptose:LPS heptosyltransferase
MRILTIRACAIGDLVLNLPALRALAAANPGARFTLVGYPSILALARSFVPVDAIHSIEAQPWASLFTGPLPGLAFDAAWVWMSDATVADNLRVSGIRHVFHASAFPAFPATGHAASHLLQTINQPAPALPDLWNANATRVILHPGSGGAAKIWPRFAELARALPDATILLGPCDSPLNTGNPILQNLSLEAVAGRLRNCRVFIGNDSGITHIAAYWGTPTVALFGPTDPGIWGPLGRRVKVLQRPSLLDISVDEVMSCCA